MPAAAAPAPKVPAQEVRQKPEAERLALEARKAQEALEAQEARPEVQEQKPMPTPAPRIPAAGPEASARVDLTAALEKARKHLEALKPLLGDKMPRREREWAAVEKIAVEKEIKEMDAALENIGASPDMDAAKTPETTRQRPRRLR
jgi:hypothetical protein